MKWIHFSIAVLVFLLFLLEFVSSTKNNSDISPEAKKFVDEHYDITRQHEIENIFRGLIKNKIVYGESYFSLDTLFTDKFYLEIAIYDQYIFGWDDWYERFAEYGIKWAWNTNEYDTNHLWYGNFPTHPNYLDTLHFDPPKSKNKDTYYKMVSEYFLFDG
jgi:hypothetical protein